MQSIHLAEMEMLKADDIAAAILYAVSQPTCAVVAPGDCGKFRRSIAIHSGPRPTLGVALRRWRILHGIKQAHAAEIFGVTQSTISRWEAGLQEMEPPERAKVESLVSAKIASSADKVLATLVSESDRNLHLICDITHKLLAVSPKRASEFATPAAELLGKSLWRFATEEIRAQESSLPQCGWYDSSSPLPVEFETGPNNSPVVPIWRSRCRWTRLMLSDGTPARLVETVVREACEPT